MTALAHLTAESAAQLGNPGKVAANRIDHGLSGSPSGHIGNGARVLYDVRIILTWFYHFHPNHFQVRRFISSSFPLPFVSSFPPGLPDFSIPASAALYLFSHLLFLPSQDAESPFPSLDPCRSVTLYCMPFVARSPSSIIKSRLLPFHLPVPPALLLSGYRHVTGGVAAVHRLSRISRNTMGMSFLPYLLLPVIGSARHFFLPHRD